MSNRFRRILPAVLCLSALAAFTRAEDLKPYDKKLAAAGRALFVEHCATCHGDDAKGNGPTAGSLHFVPPDLTRLAQRSRDGFSFDKTRRMIDGRDPVKGHGGPEMPVWGDAFKTRTGTYGGKDVARKINSLVNYLASIQER